MRIFDTSTLKPTDKLPADDASWIYNGLDCCVTFEIRDELKRQLALEPQNVQETYATAMRKLPPINYMNLRGLKVDESARQYAIQNYEKDQALLQKRFDLIMTETFGWTVNWRSPVQLKTFFYGVLGLKEVRKRDARGNFSPTVNVTALERFQQYHYPQIFARYILAMRVLGKKISFLKTGIDPDGRMRTNLNIAGTDTGRLSSAFSAFGTGTNLQNVEDRLRAIFKPNPDMIFVNVDLEQADARNVAAKIYNIFYDSHGPEEAGRYLDACESGDLHTQVTRMTYPDMDWTGDLKLDRALADQIVYRDLSYRDMSKKLGHGTNYYGLPFTMAMHTKTEQYLIERFQIKYFKAFPLIGNYEKDLTKDDWHGWVHRQLRDTGSLTNLFGRRRIFFDRYQDANTLRAAIAYGPQSDTGEELDRGWINLWENMPEAELRLPVHDSILFELPFEELHTLLPRALELLKVTIELAGGRKFSVPLEAATGWNWAKSRWDKNTKLWENPYGLRKWTGQETRLPPKSKKRLQHYL